jgi:hypothetical protein
MMADLGFGHIEYLKGNSCHIINEAIICGRFGVDFTRNRDRRDSSAPVHRSRSYMKSCAVSTRSPSIGNHKLRFELGKAQSIMRAWKVFWKQK